MCENEKVDVISGNQRKAWLPERLFLYDNDVEDDEYLDDV